MTLRELIDFLTRLEGESAQVKFYGPEGVPVVMTDAFSNPYGDRYELHFNVPPTAIHHTVPAQSITYRCDYEHCGGEHPSKSNYCSATRIMSALDS